MTVQLVYRHPQIRDERLVYAARYADDGTDSPSDDLFETRENFPIFDEHDEHDEHGKLVRHFGPSELQEICNACNKRVDDTGDLAPITIGHTNEGGPEVPVVGFGKEFRVGRLKNGRAAILCKAKFYRHKFKGGELLMDYPRRSIELWGKDKIIDPIALLGGTTPERDLGVTYYSRDGHATHYQAAYSGPGYPTGPDINAGQGAGTQANRASSAMEKPETQEMVAAFLQTDVMRWLRNQMNKEQDVQAAGALARAETEQSKQQTQQAQQPQQAQPPQPQPPQQGPPAAAPHPAAGPPHSPPPHQPPPHPAQPQHQEPAMSEPARHARGDYEGTVGGGEYTREGSAGQSVMGTGDPSRQSSDLGKTPHMQPSNFDPTGATPQHHMDTPKASTSTTTAPTAGGQGIKDMEITHSKHCANCGSPRKYWSQYARGEDPSNSMSPGEITHSSPALDGSPSDPSPSGMAIPSSPENPSEPSPSPASPSSPSSPSGPSKHSAAAAAASPSATSVFAPNGGGHDRTRMSADTNDVTRYQRENEELRTKVNFLLDENKKQHDDKVRYQRRTQLERLKSDGILLDVEQQMTTYGAWLNDEQWKSHVNDFAAKQYARARPGGDGPPVTPTRMPVESFAHSGGGTKTQADLRKIADYAGKHNMSFADAMTKMNGQA